MYRHALRNALIPVISIVGILIPRLLGGAIITETIFGWPGMGQAMVLSATGRDYPMVMGLTVVVAVAVIATNLLGGYWRIRSSTQGLSVPEPASSVTDLSSHSNVAVAVMNNPPGDRLEDHEFIETRRDSGLRRLLRHRTGLPALCILVLVHVAVFLGPFVWTISPTATDPLNSLAGSSHAHLLGVDDLGRDELSRLLYGGQITLIVGFVSMVVLVVVGVVTGAIAAFVGGWADIVLMRFTDAMLAIPTFFFVLVALTVFPRNVLTVSLVIAAGAWMQVTRVVYGETLRWKDAEFVQATYAMGLSRMRILARHVLPQVYPSIIVSATLGIAFAILTETAISYLGLGIQPPTASWGNMLQSAQTYVWTAPEPLSSRASPSRSLSWRTTFSATRSPTFKTGVSDRNQSKEGTHDDDNRCHSGNDASGCYPQSRG